MKNWFNSLQTREKQLMIAATVVVVLFIFYLFIWLPIDKNTQRLNRQLASQKITLAAMQQMAPRIRTLQQSGSKSARRSSNASLTALIYQTGQSRLKGAQLKRVEEGQQHSVRVWIEKVAFDDMLFWLESLRNQYGIDVDSIVAEREAEPGLVNVRLTLKQS